MKIFIIIVQCLCLFVAGTLGFGKPQFDPFDSYGDISWEMERAHLNNFAVVLQHEQDTIGYIIVYAGRRSCAGEALDRALRAKKYLVETRAIPAKRLRWIDGGYREQLTTVLQPVPLDAPKYTPVPTLKPSEVQIIKNCKPKISRRRKLAKSR